MYFGLIALYKLESEATLVHGVPTNPQWIPIITIAVGTPIRVYLRASWESTPVWRRHPQVTMACTNSADTYHIITSGNSFSAVLMLPENPSSRQQADKPAPRLLRSSPEEHSRKRLAVPDGTHI